MHVHEKPPALPCPVSVRQLGLQHMGVDSGLRAAVYPSAMADRLLDGRRTGSAGLLSCRCTMIEGCHVVLNSTLYSCIQRRYHTYAMSRAL